jgi:hypothetical protein
MSIAGLRAAGLPKRWAMPAAISARMAWPADFSANAPIRSRIANRTVRGKIFLVGKSRPYLDLTKTYAHFLLGNAQVANRPILSRMGSSNRLISRRQTAEKLSKPFAVELHNPVGLFKLCYLGAKKACFRGESATSDHGIEPAGGVCVYRPKGLV